jgi:hypothetical protein
MLFSFKQTLRDEAQLTPVMVQFYEHSITELQDKLRRLNSNGPYVPSPRSTTSKVPADWPSN